MKRKVIASGLAMVLIFSVSAFIVPTDKYFEITRNLDIFASLFKEVNAYYVDEIDPKKSIRSGIDAMLESLDPYTNYIPEEDLDAYVTMTTGEYGGIGALIGNLNNKVIITMPNEGFPADKAGVRIGDEIIQVDEVNCEGKSTQEVSALLKGNSGTELILKVKRDEEILSFNITRAKIVINNVPYSGMVTEDIGYIKLTEFTTDAAKEVKSALQTLKKKGATKVVLDVRGNPGGILQEATQICNLFIPKNKLVVETKGKTPNWNQVYKTSSKPIDTEIPLVVLTSSRSASAAEIVSGTIQDYDRGVLVGRRTFGKGLVQTTRPLGYNSQLKLTVAKYYTPSGRCIQAIDYAHRNEDGSVGKIPDSLQVAFKTANGRTVYDGGGIKPDIEVEAEYYSPIAMSLLAEGYIFNYANKYFREYPTQEIDMTSFIVSDEDYDKFLLSFDKSTLKYRTELERAVNNFENEVKKADQHELLSDEIASLKLAVSHNQAEDLKKHKEEIKQLLSEEIVARYHLLKGEIANSLPNDPDLAKAIAILNNPAEYNRLLSADL
jgi:carboxyl-terminal processing protease